MTPDHTASKPHNERPTMPEFQEIDDRFVMEAQTYSRCLTCGETIEPGDDIVHVSLDDTWVHGECA